MYPSPMKLTTARLCLDCDEVHDAQHCPSCGSESFAFLTRWVDPGGQRPAARGEPVPVPADPDRLEAVRALTLSAPRAPGAARRLLGAVAGLATLGVAGWIWSSSREASRHGKAASGPDRSSGEGGSDLL